MLWGHYLFICVANHTFMDSIEEMLAYIEDYLGTLYSPLPELVYGANMYLGNGAIQINENTLDQELCEELTHYVHDLINPCADILTVTDYGVRSTLTEYLAFYVACSMDYNTFLYTFQSDPNFDDPVDSVLKRTLVAANQCLQFQIPFAIGHGLGYGLARLSLLDGIDKDHTRVVARMTDLKSLDAILRDKVEDCARHTMYNMFAVPKNILDGQGFRNPDYRMYWD